MPRSWRAAAGIKTCWCGSSLVEDDPDAPDDDDGEFAGEDESGAGGDDGDDARAGDALQATLFLRRDARRLLGVVKRSNPDAPRHL